MCHIPWAANVSSGTRNRSFHYTQLFIPRPWVSDEPTAEPTAELSFEPGFVSKSWEILRGEHSDLRLRDMFDGALRFPVEYHTAHNFAPREAPTHDCYDMHIVYVEVFRVCGHHDEHSFGHERGE